MNTPTPPTTSVIAASTPALGRTFARTAVTTRFSTPIGCTTVSGANMSETTCRAAPATRNSTLQRQDATRSIARAPETLSTGPEVTFRTEAC